MPLRPLDPIGGGLFEGATEGRKPRGTYIDGRNVRGTDARSGRACWGAQRAGLEAVGDASLGSVPTHLFQSERVILREQWRDLTGAPVAGVTPAQASVVWSTNLLGGTPLDVRRSLDGVAYVLMDTGEIVLVNGDGGVSERVPSQVPFGMRPVPRLAVDTEGGIFLAATRDEPFPEVGSLGGVASLLVRLVKSSTDVWQAVWQARFEVRMSTFTYEDGHMYAVLDPPEPASGDRGPAELVRMAQPLATGEVAWRVSPLPRPVFDVAIGRGGSALISCPSSPVRFGVDGTAFTARSVGWTPHNLVVADLKLHAWVSADLVNDKEMEPDSGDAIVVMNDRRKKPNPWVEIGGVTRDLRRPPGLFFESPIYDESAFGGLGGIKFNPQSVLRSGPNVGTELEQQESLIPATGGWAMVMVVQLDAESIAAPTPRLLWSQRSTRAGHASYTGTTDGPDLLASDDASLVSTAAVDVTAASPGGSLAAVVTLFVPTAGAPAQWRINGTLATPGANWPTLDSFGPFQLATVAGVGTGPNIVGPRFVAGEGVPNEANVLLRAGVVLSVVGAPYITFSQQRLLDGSSATKVYFNDPLATPKRVTANLGAVVTGIDSCRLKTNARSVLIQWGTDATFGTITQSWSFDLGELPSLDAGNGQRVYDLRLGYASVMNIQHIRWVFNDALTGSCVVSSIELRAQDLNRSLVADSWWLYEAVVLRTTNLADVTPVEGYLARKVGLLHELDAGHPYKSTMPPVPGEPVDVGRVRETMLSPYPLLLKIGSDGSPLAAITGAGMGLGAVATEDGAVLTWGEPNPLGGGAPNAGTIARKVIDIGRAFQSAGGWLVAAGSEIPLVVPTRLATSVCGSLFVPFQPAPGSTGTEGVRRYAGSNGALRWSVPLDLLVGIDVAGLEIDESALGGACGPEFLFALRRATPHIHRIGVTGRLDTGVADRVETSRMAITAAGDVRRLVNGTWTTVASGVLPGERPWSVSLFGKIILGDGRGYRVWDQANQTLRDFAASVKGYLPPRARLALGHRGRLYLVGDNPYALYASRYGDVFDWDLGPIIEDVNQAVAGTTSREGQLPEAITALMPLRDDVLLVGTARRQFAIVGDLGRGGTLSEVDPANGVAAGYAWCVSPLGLYYFSSNGGLWLRRGQDARLVSEGRIQRRLEDVDQDEFRVELAYRWQDATVHVFLLPRRGPRERVVHFVFEERSAAWHMDEFGGGIGRAVTAVATLDGRTSGERTLALGFHDGWVRDLSSFALDDDGQPVGSWVTIGPLVGADGLVEAEVYGVEGQLASDQAGVEVAVRASDSADVPGPVLESGELAPGRGYGIGLRGSGSAVYIDVRGLGRAWAIHELAVDGAVAGMRGPER